MSLQLQTQINIKKVTKDLRILDNLVGVGAAIGLDKGGKKLLNKVYELALKNDDSGELVGSISKSKVKMVNKNKLKVVVLSGAKYSSVVEFGRRPSSGPLSFKIKTQKQANRLNTLFKRHFGKPRMPAYKPDDWVYLPRHLGTNPHRASQSTNVPFMIPALEEMEGAIVVDVSSGIRTAIRLMG